jgi:hypothetical protein
VQYCTPEVYNYEAKRRSADAPPLGCASPEMCTVLAGESADASADFRCLGGEADESFHGNLMQAGEWIARQRDEGSMRLPPKVLDSTKHMLRPNPSERPSAADPLSQPPDGGKQPCCLSPCELYKA